MRPFGMFGTERGSDPLSHRVLLILAAALLAGCPAVIEVEGDHDFRDLREALQVTERSRGEEAPPWVLLSSFAGACERRQATIDALVDAEEVEVSPPDDWGDVQQVRAWCDASVERAEAIAAAYATNQSADTWSLALTFYGPDGYGVGAGTFPFLWDGGRWVDASVQQVIESPWEPYVDSDIDCSAYADAVVAEDRVWALPLGPTGEDFAEGLDTWRAAGGQVVVDGDDPVSIRVEDLVLNDAYSRYAGTLSLETPLEECFIDDEENLL